MGLIGVGNTVLGRRYNNAESRLNEQSRTHIPAPVGLPYHRLRRIAGRRFSDNGVRVTGGGQFSKEIYFAVSARYGNGVIYRLTGSIPVSVLKELRFEREQEGERIVGAKNSAERNVLLQSTRWRYFERVEKLLDGSVHGPFWLQKPEIAAIVDEAIRYRDGKEYDLIAHTIMPNHVHMVFQLPGTAVPDGTASRPTETAVRRVADPTIPRSNTEGPYRVTDILASLKKYTALRANRVLGRRGAFWHSESYDQVYPVR